VPEYDRETSIVMRLWPTRGCRAIGKRNRVTTVIESDTTWIRPGLAWPASLRAQPPFISKYYVSGEMSQAVLLCRYEVLL
jgi:hypothetical protein